jgi:HSP20 family protein
MQLIRRATVEAPTWSPFDRIFGLRNELNRLFDNPLTELARSTEFFNVWVPPLDLYEDKDHLTVKVELPGMKKEDIALSVHEGALSISGERKEQNGHEDSETYRSERLYGKFNRTVTLPSPVAVDKIKASYKDGILTVTLPKTEEAKPRQIEVNAG